MNGLELGVGDRGLGDRRQILAPQERRLGQQRAQHGQRVADVELAHQARLDGGRAQRAVEPAAEPVLDLPNLTRRRIRLVCHQRRVDRGDVAYFDRRRVVRASDGLLHGPDICGDRARAPVGGARIGQRTGQVQRADLVPLDTRRGNRLRA